MSLIDKNVQRRLFNLLATVMFLGTPCMSIECRQAVGLTLCKGLILAKFQIWFGLKTPPPPYDGIISYILSYHLQ